jgi:hypothetical protein
MISIFLMDFLRIRVFFRPNFGTNRMNPAHHGRARGQASSCKHSGVITVQYHVLRAAYEIPLCVSYLFLVVQSFRALLNDMREQYAQSPEA